MAAENHPFDAVRAQVSQSQADLAGATPFLYDPAVSLNPNRGSLSKTVTIPFPPNLVGVQGLTLRYESQNPENIGWGTGWTLELPQIVPNRSADNAARFLVSGPMGRGLLVATDEDLSPQAARIRKILGASAARTSTRSFRYQLDFENYSLFIKSESDDSDSAWIMLHPSGTAWVFSSDGKPTRTINPRGQTIHWVWRNGFLISAVDSAQQWKLEIQYQNSDQDFPKFNSTAFSYTPNGVKTLQISHPSAKIDALYNFSYSGTYLTRITQKGALLPIFQAVYAKPSSQKWVDGNSLSPSRKEIPIYRESIASATYLPIDKDYLWIDINGDGRTDRVYLGEGLIKQMTTEMDSEFQSEIQKVIKEVDKATVYSQQEAENLFAEKVDGRRQQLNAKFDAIIRGKSDKIRFEIAQFDPANQTVAYVEDKALQLAADTVMPFRVWMEYDASAKAATRRVTNAGTFFVDMYGTGKKSLVNCIPGSYAEEKTFVPPGADSGPSNLHLSILSLVAPEQVPANATFTSTWDAQTGPAEVWEQQLDREAILSRWQAVAETTAPFRNRPPLLGVHRWVKRQESFRCNAHSLFFDANQDGIMDVLTGKTLYLRGLGFEKTVTLEHPLLTNALQRLFSVPEKIDPNTDQHTLLWEPSTGQFELRNGHVTADLEQGLRRLDGFGTTQTQEPQPQAALLTKLIAPTGGTQKVEYQFVQGAWAVKKLIRTPGGKQPSSESTFSYESANRDPLTGVFLGFGQTRETRRVLDPEERVPEHDIVRTYFEDRSAPVIAYQSRARLQGLLLQESIRKPAPSGAESGLPLAASSKDYKWAIGPFKEASSSQPLRWLAYPKTTEERTFLASGEVSSGKRVIKTILNWYTDLTGRPFLPKEFWERVEDIRTLSSKQGSALTPAASNTYESWKYIPEFYRTALTQRKSTDKNDVAYRHPVVFYPNPLGEREMICEGELCTRYTLDDQGRVIEQRHTNGAWAKATYTPDSPQIATFRDQDTGDAEYRIITDPISGRMNSLSRPEGREIVIEYTAEGVPTRLQTRDALVGTYNDRFVRELKTEQSSGALREETYAMQEWVDGRASTHELDGWGRIHRSQSETPDGWVYSGESLRTPEGQELETSLPSFKGFISAGEKTQRSTQKMWDALGRLRSDWSFADGNWKYSYHDFCTSRQLNNTLKIQRCSNVFDRPVSLNFYGDEAIYKTNFLGDIQETADQKSWQRDLHGEIIQSQGKGGTSSGDTATWNHFLKVDHAARTTETETGWWSIKDPTGRLLETKRLKNSQPTDLFENREYQFGRLRRSTMTPANGQSVSALEQTFTYNSAGLPVSHKIGNIQVERRFDGLDRKITETTGVDQTSATTLEFRYQKGFLTRIPGLVAEIQRTEEGAIRSIQYENGLQLKRTYDRRSPRLAQLSIENGLGSNFQETYTYDPVTHLLKGRDGESVLQQRWIETFAYQGESRGNSVFLSDAPSASSARLRRDKQGRLIELPSTGGSLALNWNDDRLAQMRDTSIYYNSEGSWVAACAMGKPISAENCTIRLDADRISINGTVVSLHRVEGLPVAIQHGTELFPVVSDHLGSIRALWSSDGKVLLWSRKYAAWGNKTVSYNEAHRALAEKLEKACIWSFAGLVEIPGVQVPLYWSTSRVYSPSIQEWLNPDPMVRWLPQRADQLPGNWASTRYANNSPVNYVDPSGHWVHIAAGGLIGGIAGGLEAARLGKDFGGIALGATVGATFGAFGAAGLGIIFEGASLAAEGVYSATLAAGETAVKNKIEGTDFRSKKTSTDAGKSALMSALPFGAGRLAGQMSRELQAAVSGRASKRAGELTDTIVSSSSSLLDSLKDILELSGGYIDRSLEDSADTDYPKNFPQDKPDEPKLRN